MNTISTFNLRELHCDIYISKYAFPYIDEQLQFSCIAIITHDNNSRLYSLHTQIACVNKTRFFRTRLLSFYNLHCTYSCLTYYHTRTHTHARARARTEFVKLFVIYATLFSFYASYARYDNPPLSSELFLHIILNIVREKNFTYDIQ